MSRQAARVDANQPEIVAALHNIGASVQLLHQVGGGCPDLLVGYRHNNYLIEIKDGNKTPGNRPLTPKQVTWHAAWRGQKAIALNPEDAIAIITGGGNEP